MRKRYPYVVLFLAVTATSFLWEASTDAAPIDFNKNGKVDPYEDSSVPIDQRVEDLLSKMTIEEKVGQATTLYGYPRILTSPVPTEEWNNRVWTNGLANIDEHCNGFGGDGKRLMLDGKVLPLLDGPPSVAVEAINETQRWFIEKTRLGIPVEFTNEGIRGACVAGGTSFPAQLGLGSSWDRKLVAEVGRITALENRAMGYSNTYAPILDVPRDPRWGRIIECYGEDPYLVSELGVVMVKALQAHGTTSTPKHYAAYSMPEGGRDHNARTAPSIGPRELHTLYMRPFRRAFIEGNAHGTMVSYNDWDGDPVCSSKYFLTDLLRGEYGFQGYVVSDSDAVEFIYLKYRIVPDYKHAVAAALMAGTNVRTTFREPETFTGPLTEAAKEGILPMDVLDQRTREVLRYKFSIGLFEHPYVEDPQAANEIIGSDEHHAIAKKASEESIVLLKNDGLLPLDPSHLKKVLICGPLARDTHFGISRYGPQQIEVETMDASLRRIFGEQIQFSYAKGCAIVDERFPESDILPEPPTVEEQQLIDEAVASARDVDVIVLFLGGATRMTVGESRSRSSLKLPGHQEILLKALHATGKPVVLVLVDGRPSSINWADKHVPAILFAGFGGQFGGEALAKTLIGEVNPSAKTTVTWPKTVGQIPYAFPYKPSARSAGKARVDGSLYPFGHGLSYTSFAYDNLKIENQKPALGEPVAISFTLTNTGDCRGTEIPQLYLQDQVCSVNRSFTELAGFDRIELEPGESRVVHFTLTDEQLQLLNMDMEWVVEPGRFSVYIGASSEDIRLPPNALENSWAGQLGNDGFPELGRTIESRPIPPLAINEFEVIP